MERLQKILAHAGVASRRQAEEMIVEGHVRVNGKIVTQLGTKVDPTRDQIQVDGETIRVEKQVYVILHKPKGYLSDVDPSTPSVGQAGNRGKPFAIDLVKSRERVYPAGRLDANSEGLLLLTNDGELAHRITHPRFEHEKEYLGLVVGEPSDGALEKLRKGIWYEGERLRADCVERAERRQRFGVSDRGQSWLKIILHEGKKRQVRHMCAAVGHPVLRLIRTRIGPIELGALRAGQWRALNANEVRDLKRGTSGKKQIDSIYHRGDPSAGSGQALGHRH